MEVLVITDIDKILKDLDLEVGSMSRDELIDYLSSFDLNFTDDITGIEYNKPKKKVIRVKRPKFTTKIK